PPAGASDGSTVAGPRYPGIWASPSLAGAGEMSYRRRYRYNGWGIGWGGAKGGGRGSMDPKTTDPSIERMSGRAAGEKGRRQIGPTTLFRLSVYYAVVLGIVAGFILLTDNMRGTRFGGPKPEAADSAAQLTSSFFEPLFRSLPPLGTGAAAGIASFLLALPV